MNRLHVYFEEMRGDYDAPPDFFRRAPDTVKNAIINLNLLIHRWESFIYNETHQTLNSRVHCTFNRRPRHSLHDQDYEHFTMTRTFGTVYVNYCETGKPLYDVFKDGDIVIGEHNIKPLRYYSSDFMIAFHNGITVADAERFRITFDAWFDRNANFLIAHGFYKNDPKLALGLIPVASLDSAMGERGIIDAIASRQRIAYVKT